MERRIRIGSDFILIVWMLLLVALLFGACSSDEDINPKSYRVYEETEYDYRFMDEGYAAGLPQPSNFPEYDIASADTVNQRSAAHPQKEEEF